MLDQQGRAKRTEELDTLAYELETLICPENLRAYHQVLRAICHLDEQVSDNERTELSEKFTMATKRALSNDLTPLARLMCGILEKAFYFQEYCEFRNQDFMELLNISEQTVTQSLTELEKQGYICIENRNSPMRRIYPR